MTHPEDHMMDWGAMGGFMWVGMLIWAILGIALVVLVVVEIVWLVRHPGRDAQGRRRLAEGTAIEELELRYARGEVTERRSSRSERTSSEMEADPAHFEAMRSVPRRARAAALAVTIALLLGFAGPSAVLAHAGLVSSTPADGAELASPPTEIRLVFSEAPRLDSLSVRLFDRRGTEVALGEPAPGPLPTTVIVPILTELRPGPYTVVWFVVSAEDEHPETKEFVFGIGEPPGAPSVTAGQLSDATGNTLLPASTLLAILGLTLMLGAAVQARFFGLDRPRVAWLALVGAGVSAFALVVRAVGAPRAVATITDGSSGLFSRLDPTDLARVALLGVFVALVLAGGQAAAGTTRRRLWLGAVLAGAAMAWVQAASSHAAGVGILPWVSLAWQGIDMAIADPSRYAWFGVAFEAARQLNILVAAAHIVAIGVWVGGLLLASVSGLGRAELAAWHPRFSRIALVAFLVVAATGVYQAILYVPAPDALVDTGYGRVLVAKHIFVVGVLAMAALNRFVVGPSLRQASDVTGPARRAMRAIRVEAVVGVAVLAVTGVLATTETARPATAIFVRPDIVAELSNPQAELTADPGNVRLTVSPISETQQRFAVTASDGVLAPSRSLSLFSQTGDLERKLPLRQEGAGWVAEGLAFPRDGVWVASLPRADGSDVTFPLDVAFGRVARHDAAAREVWDAAIERTETGMRSARMIDQLTDGLSLMLFGYHEFVAPDRERFDIQGRFSSVTADGQRYFREAGADRWTVQPTGSIGTGPPGGAGSGPGSWPWFGFLRGAIGVTVAGDASQAGQRCQVLVGIDPQSDVTYEIWVGRNDGMIHRLVMGLPGHYMVNAYFDVNAPIRIEPPDGPVSPADG